MMKGCFREAALICFLVALVSLLGIVASFIYTLTATGTAEGTIWEWLPGLAIVLFLLMVILGGLAVGDQQVGMSPLGR